MKSVLFLGPALAKLHADIARLTFRENDWELTLSETPAAALKRLAARPYDALVADADLPEGRGVALMEEAAQTHPQMLRFLYASPGAGAGQLTQWGTRHRVVLKPISAEQLLSDLRKAVSLLQWLPRDAAQRLAADLQRIPSPPVLYQQIRAEMHSPQASLETVGELIARDPAMTAKVLRLANSAMLGLQQKLTDPAEAVLHLGVETVSSLILAGEAFAFAQGATPVELSLEELWNHSLVTAQFSRLIARHGRLPAETQAAAYTAGLLHDLGKLLLAVNLPQLFKQAIQQAREQQIPLWQGERTVFGVSHAEVGAAILGIWGLPLEMVQAAAWQHEPSRASQSIFGTLTIVHVANVLAHEHRAALNGHLVPSEIDPFYLERTGFAHALPGWRQLCFQAGNED